MDVFVEASDSASMIAPVNWLDPGTYLSWGLKTASESLLYFISSSNADIALSKGSPASLL